MSYDLFFFRVPEGVDPSVAFDERMEQEEEALEGEGLPLSESDLAEMKRVVDALLQWRPNMEVFTPKPPLRWIELTEEELQVQFSVQADSVSMTMPYLRKHADEMMEFVAGSFAVLEAAAGYVPFDPQLGRLVTKADLEGMLALYRKVDIATLRLDIEEGLIEVPGTKKPWWKFW